MTLSEYNDSLNGNTPVAIGPTTLSEYNNSRLNGNTPDIIGYKIPYSIQCNSSNSTHFTRVLGTPSSLTTFTLSCWIKRSSFFQSPAVSIMGDGPSIARYNSSIGFASGDDNFTINFGNGSSTTYGYYTTNIEFRDPSSWYNLVISVDSTQTTPSNRVLLFVNGVQQTLNIGIQLSLNQTLGTFVSGTLQIFSYGSLPTNYHDGYGAEYYYIDGQYLNANSFGEFDGSGVWVSKKYQGSYGNNGFYLNFSNASNLGYDFSGNGNTWTSVNFTPNSQCCDSPTNNYPTLNPLNATSTGTLSAGALKSTGIRPATIPIPNTGKFYFECLLNNTTSASNSGGIAIYDNTCVFGYVLGSSDTGNLYCHLPPSGTIGPWPSSYNHGNYLLNYAFPAGTLFQAAVDATSGYVWLGFNNQWFDSAGGLTGNPSSGTNPTFTNWTTLTASGQLFFSSFASGSVSVNVNFGQLPFTYTPPTGFGKLCSNNMPIPVVKSPKYDFGIATWTGNGTSQSFNVNFKPDLVWIKSRSNATSHCLVDSVRGVGHYYTIDLNSETTDGGTTVISSLTGFTSNSPTYVSVSGNNFISTGSGCGITSNTPILTGDFSIQFVQQNQSDSNGVLGDTFQIGFSTSLGTGAAPYVQNSTSFYYLSYNGVGTSQTISLINGRTVLATATATVSNGDVFVFNRIGSTISIVQNGTTIITNGSAPTSNGYLVVAEGGTPNITITFGSLQWTVSGSAVTSFTNTGFNIGSNSLVNNNGSTYIGWCWKAGDAAIVNNNGSITSMVSANNKNGFSIVSYTGNGGTPATVGHGLNTAPAFMIIKDRGAANNPVVYHQAIGAANAMFLNRGDASAALSGAFNSTSPTSTVFAIGSGSGADTNSTLPGRPGPFIAYCWTPIDGFSSFGSYTSNASSNGPFVYTGFRPRWILLKNSTTGSSDWEIFDTSRIPVNGSYAYLTADQSAAEKTGTTRFDILSNGFKVRIASSTDINNSSDTIIYAAFAENPFIWANSR